jgi:SpoVK/Ycf46/Vps4 family AAA+-type ATPase
MEMKIDDELEVVSGRTLPEVDLLPQLKEIEGIISRTCEYFFKGNLVMKNSPFKGFILEGPPGTGKTEIIKQVARKLDRRLQTVSFLFVDGASIAAPKWGDAEKKLRSIFRWIKKQSKNSKLLILFDDIESLMLTRGTELAKEWHYSINSILFHEIDKLNPYKVIVCATTNRPDLVDEAIRTRLYPIQAPNLPLDQLMIAVNEILEASNMKNEDKKFVAEKIKEKLKKMENPTIRDARQITVMECIERRLWSV